MYIIVHFASDALMRCQNEWVQITAWCLSQSRPRSNSRYGVTRPRWVTIGRNLLFYYFKQMMSEMYNLGSHESHLHYREPIIVLHQCLYHDKNPKAPNTIGNTKYEAMYHLSGCKLGTQTDHHTKHNENILTLFGTITTNVLDSNILEQLQYQMVSFKFITVMTSPSPGQYHMCLLFCVHSNPKILVCANTHWY